MMPFVDDADFTLYVGDVREVLAEMPAGSVNCCVTSPPYWGLRDYQTGEWEGGDPECDHKQGRDGAGRADGIVDGRGQRNRDGAAALTRSVCRCGATRVDQQIGLEPTPDEYVSAIVEVFREVRRVLADHGTLWLNLGDSYNTYAGNRGISGSTLEGRRQHLVNRPDVPQGAGLAAADLKQKDIVGIPWRVAFALQEDGWYLRSDIIWAKPNPMPESVTDRPTKAHEYVFLLSKQPRYYFDQEAVRESASDVGRSNGRDGRSSGSGFDLPSLPPGARPHTLARKDFTSLGRNVRSVWKIATQPYAEAHFATFPEELPRRCIAAGCPEQVCATCGKPSKRILERTAMVIDRSDRTHPLGQTRSSGTMREPATTTTGWTDCGHDDWRPGVVLDPFMGSGTTALVARKMGRRAVGVELNPEYAALCAKRLQQQSLFA